jgi:hypothetical protein
MEIDDSYFAPLMIVVLGTLAISAEIYDNWKQRKIEHKENKKKIIDEWSVLNIEKFSDLKGIEEKCNYLDETLNKKKALKQVTNGNLETFKTNSKDLCSNWQKFSDIYESIEKINSDIKDRERKLNDIKHELSSIDTEVVKVLRSVPMQDGSITYMIGIDGSVGVVNSRTSETRYINVNEVMSLELEPEGTTTFTNRFGRKEIYPSYVIIDEYKIEKLKSKRRKLDSEIEESKTKLKQLKNLITKKSKSKVTKNIDGIKEVIEK